MDIYREFTLKLSRWSGGTLPLGNVDITCPSFVNRIRCFALSTCVGIQLNKHHCFQSYFFYISYIYMLESANMYDMACLKKTNASTSSASCSIIPTPVSKWVFILFIYRIITVDNTKNYAFHNLPNGLITKWTTTLIFQAFASKLLSVCISYAVLTI